MKRDLAVIVLVLVVLVLWALMYVGWRGRGRRQADVPRPPQAPDSLREKATGGDAGWEATYVSTTSTVDWLDRVSVHGLGVRSAARVLVDPAGVLIARIGAEDLFVPAAALRDVRRETMRAGKALAGGGLVVLEWSLGDTLVATALAPRSDIENLVAAARALIETGSPVGEGSAR